MRRCLNRLALSLILSLSLNLGLSQALCCHDHTHGRAVRDVQRLGRPQHPVVIHRVRFEPRTAAADIADDQGQKTDQR